MSARKPALTRGCESGGAAVSRVRTTAPPAVTAAVSIAVRGCRHRGDMTAPQRSSRFSLRLDLEWAHLRTARRSLRHARSWATADSYDALTSLVVDIDDLADVIAATQRGAGPVGSDDSILLRLVELARHDELAGRIVIQRILPGLISQAVRFRSFHDDVDPVELVVPTAWLVIRAFDTDRRRHHVAASLISDAVYQAFRQPLRRRSSTEVALAPRAFGAVESTDASSPIVELAEVIRDAVNAGVSGDDIELLRQIVRADSPTQVARQRRVTDRTLRNHRSRAVANIRSAIAA